MPPPPGTVQRRGGESIRRVERLWELPAEEAAITLRSLFIDLRLSQIVLLLRLLLQPLASGTLSYWQSVLVHVVEGWLPRHIAELLVLLVNHDHHYLVQERDRRSAEREVAVRLLAAVLRGLPEEAAPAVISHMTRITEDIASEDFTVPSEEFIIQHAVRRRHSTPEFHRATQEHSFFDQPDR